MISLQTKTTFSFQTFSLRRQLRGELAEMKEIFDRYPAWVDRIAIEVKDWHRRFLEGLNSAADEERTLAIFTEQLKEVLYDPMTVIRSPLEENSYLGNDGNVYGYQALCYYLYHMPREGEGRSPFALEGAPSFFVVGTPHPIVKAAVLWLSKRGSNLPPHPDIERVCEELKAQNKLPELPTEEVVRYRERARRLIAKGNERRQKIIAESEKEVQASAARIDALFADVFRKEAEIRDAQKERLEAEKTRDEEAIRVLEEEQDFWRNRVTDISGRVQVLQERLANAEEGTSQEERDTLRLEISVQETSRAIAERNAKREKGGFASLFITLASIAVSAALKQAGFFAAPVKGGLQFGVMKPF